MTRTTSREERRGQVSITAPVVTDATAPALLGMSSRQFREAVTRQHIPFMKLGQRTVVFFADLQALAHRNATLAERDAHPEPRDRHNRQLAASTEVDDFWASVEHLDERDTVNAILRRVGRQLTADAYRDFNSMRRPRAAGVGTRCTRVQRLAPETGLSGPLAVQSVYHERMRDSLQLAPTIDFLFTENHHGYADVLADAIEHGGDLFFVAYAVLDDGWLELLQTGIQGVDRIEFITNIPNFEYRHGYGSWGKNAREEVEKYLSVLHPDALHGSVAVSIVMRNHAKLAISDRVAYVGSANFSDASAKKKEAGVLIKDAEIAGQLKAKYMTLFRDDIHPYNPAARSLVAARALLDEGCEVLTRLEARIAEFRDPDTDELQLHDEDIQEWSRLAATALEILYEGVDGPSLEEARIERPPVLDQAHLRELLHELSGDAVRAFIAFSATKYVERRVQEMTASNAEALDEASEIANDEAAERLRELSDEARGAVESVISELAEVADAAVELSNGIRRQLRALAHLGA